MKVHITLVGKQTLPVFIPALNYAPDKVYLICSKETEEPAMVIQAKLCQLRKKQITVKVLFFDPVDIKKIKKGIKRLNSELSPDDNISVNVSGGTKTWSIVFYQMFCSRKNTICFYHDQNGYMWDFKTGEAVETTTSNVSFNDLCALHNVEIESLTNITEYNNEDDDCLQLIREMYDANSFGFVNLTKKMYETGCNKVKTDDGSIEVDYSNQNSYNIDLKGYSYIELCSPHLPYLLFNTGWFEYLVASFLSSWEQQKEIFLNVKFKLQETGVESNEVDIVVRTEKKYLFVECKTSAFSPSDVDKFNDVAKNYGGIATKRIFITYKEPSKKNVDKYQKYSTVASKCKKLRMPFFVYTNMEKNPSLFFDQLNKYMAELNE